MPFDPESAFAPVDPSQGQRTRALPHIVVRPNAPPSDGVDDWFVPGDPRTDPSYPDDWFVPPRSVAPNTGQPAPSPQPNAANAGVFQFARATAGSLRGLLVADPGQPRRRDGMGPAEPAAVEPIVHRQLRRIDSSVPTASLARIAAADFGPRQSAVVINSFTTQPCNPAGWPAGPTGHARDAAASLVSRGRRLARRAGHTRDAAADFVGR
jgi:hypothetical protein